MFVHTTVAARDTHYGYARAKAGDVQTALALAIDLLNPSVTRALHDMVALRSAILLPVVAEEATGFNAIPDAMAQVLGRELGLRAAAGEVVQTNKVGHTRAPSFQRLVTPAMFEGPVYSGTPYVLVDDHVGLGGTLANLRGYVEARGGVVKAMTTLTESRDACQISLQSGTHDMLRQKHGEALDQLWQQQFGYGIECLTELEALQLCRQPSVAAIEDFLAKAAIEARGRGLSPAT